jgi:hypothetical protein
MTKEEMDRMARIDDAANGIYVDPDAYEDLDMLAIREYMKKNNLKGPLSEEELKQFRRS